MQVILSIFFFGAAMTFSQAKVLLLDETAKRNQESAVSVRQIRDVLNRSAIEDAIKDSAKLIKSSEVEIHNAKVFDIAEITKIEMFEGLPGQHIRHITVDYKFYLYSIGNYQGLAAIRGNQILAHYIYFSQDDWKLKILDDINDNGIDELMIQAERIDSRGYFRSVRIIELTNSGIEQIFFRNSYENPTGVPKQYLRTTAAKIYVQEGKTPVYYEEEFERIDGFWKIIGSIKEITDYQTKVVDYIEITKPNLTR